MQIIKRYFSIILILIALVGCNKGSINGTLTYQLTENMFPNADYYAQVYFTKNNTDTIEQYLKIVRIGEEKQKIEHTIKYSVNEQLKDSLKQQLISKNREYTKLYIDSVSFHNLSHKAMKSFINIIENPKTKYMEADENGVYGGALKEGNYNVIFVSEALKKNNLLEKRGMIILQKQSINSDSVVNISLNFK